MPERTLGLGPCAEYKHDHPPVRNVIAEHEERFTLGQRVADRVALVVGSWPFIIVQSGLFLVWVAINVYLVFNDKLEEALKRVERNDQRIVALLARLEQAPPSSGAAGVKG